MKSTMTSWPMRGMNIAPHPAPAHNCDTPFQAGGVFVVLTFAIPMEWTFTPAVFVDVISSPAGPVDEGCLGPSTTGFGGLRVGRKGTLEGIHWN